MLLDTCALLWLAQGGGAISSQTLHKLAGAPFIYVSAITGFEVGIKFRNGKLELPAQPSEWFKAILRHHDINLLPLDLEICMHSTQLPPFHNDPCDRMIIATAQAYKMPVVTADPVFKNYDVETIF